jgi:hypothetical protein
VDRPAEYVDLILGRRVVHRRPEEFLHGPDDVPLERRDGLGQHKQLARRSVAHDVVDPSQD